MRYLSMDEVLAIHEEMVDRFGGSHGIRDMGLLYSAIYRPQASFAGVELYQTIFDKAAALIHSLLLNHAFTDANKRTSYSCCARFLYLNRYDLEASTKQIIFFTKGVENKKLNLDDIRNWLKAHSKRK